MGPSMCTLWLMIKFLGALLVLLSSYCCSSYGAVNPVSSLGPFSSSSIVNPVHSEQLTEGIHLYICQALAKRLRRQLYQAPVSKHLLVSTKN